MNTTQQTNNCKNTDAGNFLFYISHKKDIWKKRTTTVAYQKPTPAVKYK